MKYGTEIYKECNHCGGSLTLRPLLEVNARTATLWSDGYVDSPMVPQQPLLVKCGHCKAEVWLPELKTSAFNSADSALKYLALDEEGLWLLLERYGQQPSEHQLYIRLNLWQLANHKYRREKTIPVEWSARERSNMKDLLMILDMNSVQERLLAAELLRQLGDFEEAEEPLQAPLEGSAFEVSKQLLHRIKHKQQQVFKCRLQPSSDELKTGGSG
ncbi:hypothetical protein Ssed_2458 [Shewanella sediminis HAW-EB3]|uniref:CpXC domain-containing protein n=1 Tax=Shewanella sediminis (strain HAW-EB3) TaxID=425104 RepID=A8FW44_SHESH|nr:hypothetical protein [Shewanella sediminis]ABV37067.1 hypothetical protein Ssed_2458 [Shewanella sediminis HAW-EB3]